METVAIGAGYNQSMAERLANGVLPLPYALICATDIASTLRDLHQKGLAHGEVNRLSIDLSESGARLRPCGNRIRLTDTSSDVAAFGTVLYEMMTGLKPPSDVKVPAFRPVTTAMDLSDVRSDAIGLAEKCLDGSPDIKEVLIELRILVILARGLTAVPYPAQAVKTPVLVEAELRRLRVVEKLVLEEEEPPFPEFDDVAAEAGRVKVAELPAAVAPGRHQSPVAELTSTVEPEMPRPDAASGQSAAGVAICPRCKGDAPFTSPTSIFDKLLNKISHIRRCDVCGYRFIILRFGRHKS